MRTGLTISGAGHAAVLLWSVLALVAKPYHADQTQALPIDVISSSEFSQMTNGAKNAPQAEKPKPVAEKVAEATPVDDPTAKLAKTEIKAATDVPGARAQAARAEGQETAAAAGADRSDRGSAEEGREQEARAEEAGSQAADAAQEAGPAGAAPQFDPRKVKALLDKRDAAARGVRRQ